MAEGSICRKCFHSYVCEQFNEHKDSDNKKCHFFNDHFVPTADVVEVVRCKDCKHWDCYGGEDAHKGDCSELVGLDSCMYEDDFCSYGERRADNER